MPMPAGISDLLGPSRQSVTMTSTPFHSTTTSTSISRFIDHKEDHAESIRSWGKIQKARLSLTNEKEREREREKEREKGKNSSIQPVSSTLTSTSTSTSNNNTNNINNDLTRKAKTSTISIANPNKNFLLDESASSPQSPPPPLPPSTKINLGDSENTPSTTVKPVSIQNTIVRKDILTSGSKRPRIETQREEKDRNENEKGKSSSSSSSSSNSSEKSISTLSAPLSSISSLYSPPSVSKSTTVPTRQSGGTPPKRTTPKKPRLSEKTLDNTRSLFGEDESSGKDVTPLNLHHDLFATEQTGKTETATTIEPFSFDTYSSFGLAKETGKSITTIKSSESRSRPVNQPRKSRSTQTLASPISVLFRKSRE